MADDTIGVAHVTARFLLFFRNICYFPISQQAKNKRKVKQNEEKRKEVINFRNCVTCNVCNLDMFNTMCGCAVGRAEGYRDWIRNL